MILSYNERKKWDLCWCVDPLDGTREFIKRNDQFTVNVGLIQNSIPIFGIVSIPVTGECYIAAQGQGAYKRQTINGLFKQIYCSKFRMSDSGLTILKSRNHCDEITELYASLFKNAIYISTGSSIKFLLVAEGTAQVYPRFAPTSEWDVCASHIIVKEAGGVIKKVTFDHGKFTIYDELTYNKECLLNPYFICSGKILGE